VGYYHARLAKEGLRRIVAAREQATAAARYGAMSVLDDAQVIGVAPDISFAVFEAFLREQGSPALSAARAVYDYCVQRQVSPSMILGMFEHESSCGTAGTATQTHSWGNTRAPNFGVDYQGPTVPGRSGVFPVFRDWADGGISTVARLVEHAPYRGKTHVREIIRTWAPASDLNSPSAYATAVLARMSELRSREAPLGGSMIPKPPVISMPSPNAWLPDPDRLVEAIANHVTQGSDSLAWLLNPVSEVSANYLVARNGKIYELVKPHTGSAWVNGPVKHPDMSNTIIANWIRNGINPNHRTVGIEHEGYSSNEQGGSFTPEQWASTIRLQAWLCQEFKLPPTRERIIGHYQINLVDKEHWSGIQS